ncbi:caspase family protein [Mesorhizobium sp. URHB0026]
MISRPTIAVFAAATIAILAISDAGAAVRALVIGVDKYATKQQLRGSVNDAVDIAHVLKSDGISDLTSLTDGDATINAFTAAWKAMVERAVPGDILFLSFSGHGIRLPEKPGGHPTPDGYEKGFLLQPYDEAAAPDELLRDEDLYDLFGIASAKGVKVVFVADACHAGAAVRGIDSRSSGLPFRFQRFQTQADPIIPSQPEKVTARPPNPAVAVLSATDERLSIQEILVEGTYRGALSYAVARGLEGAAASPSGKINLGSLHGFVAPLVRVLSGNRQIPQFMLPDPELDLLSVPARTGPAEDFPMLPQIKVAVLGDAAQKNVKLIGADLTNDRSAAELIWDSQKRQLVGSAGDVLASGLAPEALQGSVDAQRVLDGLRDAMAHQYGPVSSVANVTDRALSEGAVVTRGMNVHFTVEPGDFRFITMLNINATGTVQFLWPLKELGDEEEWTAATPLIFTSPVTAPYGADFVISLLSREPLSELQAMLKKVHNKVAPLDFYRAFLSARTTAEIRIGIESVYSCENLRSDGQCDSMLPSP